MKISSDSAFENFKMPSLEALSNDELHAQTLLAASHEKSATLHLLNHLACVDSRRLYAVMGYSSLWEYAHKALKYSEPQASERVSAMRLMVRVPEVRKELETGKITLTSISKLAHHVRREKVDAEETISLLSQIKNKSTREVDRILVLQSTEQAKPDRVKALTLETTRITIDVDADFMELLKRAQELKGNHALSPKELFKITLGEFVKRREVKVKNKKVNHEGVKMDASSSEEQRARHAALHPQKVLLTPAESIANTETTKPSPKMKSRYISIKVKNSIRLRSKDQCEYLNPHTLKQCESKTGLQFEHATPYAVGGSNTVDNIFHFCPAHNRLSAIQYYGFEKMEKYLNQDDDWKRKC